MSLRDNLRTTPEAASRSFADAGNIGRQSSEVLRQYARMRLESANLLIDGSMKLTQAVIGSGFSFFARTCDAYVTRTLDATRDVLNVQSSLSEASGRLAAGTNQVMSDAMSEVSDEVAEAASHADSKEPATHEAPSTHRSNGSNARGSGKHRPGKNKRARSR